jgi:hypothetical protein
MVARVNILGSGSDYTAFMHVLGVPAIDIRYTYEEVKHTTVNAHILCDDCERIIDIFLDWPSYIIFSSPWLAGHFQFDTR